MKQEMTDAERQMADHILSAFSKFEADKTFRPKKKRMTKRLLALAAPLAAAAAIAVSLNTYSPLAPTPASWATEPEQVPTLSAAEANTLCAERAMQVIPKRMLSAKLSDNVKWLEDFHVLIDERGTHALSFYDKDGGGYSAACLLTRSANVWSADFFATRGHQGKKHVHWADLVELENGSRINFLAGWKPVAAQVSIEFDGSIGTASTAGNYYAIWMPAVASCSPVTLTESLGEQSNTTVVEFGGTDGFSSDAGMCS